MRPNRWYHVTIAGHHAQLHKTVSRSGNVIAISKADAISGFKAIYPDVASLERETVTAVLLADKSR